MVTTQHNRKEAVACRAPYELGDSLGRFLDLGKKTGVLVTDVRCFWDRSLDVSQVDILVAELPETRRQPCVANRGRAHVNATTPRAQVERRTDHGDFSAGRLKRHGQQG